MKTLRSVPAPTPTMTHSLNKVVRPRQEATSSLLPPFTHGTTRTFSTKLLLIISPLNSVYQPASQNSNHFNPTFISSTVTFDSSNFPNTSATTEHDAALQHPDFICNLSGIGGSHNFILTSATASEMDSFASDDAQPDATAS